MKAGARGREHRVSLRSGELTFRLRRSERKTLAITVNPDTSVTVLAPRTAGLAAIQARLQRRAVWIRRQQRYFETFLPTTPKRRFVSGETHLYLGRQYRLKVSAALPAGVKLQGRFLHIHVADKLDPVRVKKLVQTWYAQRARVAFERSLAACGKSLKPRLENTPRLRLRRMSKRWGSCTARGEIYLNTQLVGAPRSCIDYVVTHELCHLVHAEHSKAFYALLRQVMPDWERRKARLERVPVE